MRDAAFIFFLILLARASAAAVPPQSIGTYWKGELRHPVKAYPLFVRRPELVESVSPAGFQYGAQATVDSIFRVARWLHAQWGGGCRLIIGDLSMADGGKIARHETHQNGLDVDIAFLSSQPKREGHRARARHNRFPETFVRDGRVTSAFDVAKNYALLEHVLKTEDVSLIFLGCAIKNSLLRFHPAGEAPNARAELFAKLIAYPFHDDHFHLRLRCPAANLKCKNDPRKWSDMSCPFTEGKTKGAA